MIMRSIAEIPNIPDQDKRIEEITMDCYGALEFMSGFYTYFEDAPHYPFEAIWRDEDEPGHAEDVTVFGVSELDDRRGVLLNVKRGEKPRRVVAEQLWAKDKDSANAIVLNDYRYWLNHGGGPDVYDYY
jgi:hypothetical protein